MKRCLLTLLFTSLILLGCQNNNLSSISSSSSRDEFNPFTYIKYSSYEELKEKIENKEDFIFILTMSNCRYCQQQSNDIFDYIYTIKEEILIYEIDGMLINLELDNFNNPLNGIDAYNKSKEEYRYLASQLELVGDFVLKEEGAYKKNNYTTMFGEAEASVITPSTLVYLDGELQLPFSYLGYGWSKDEESFRGFFSMYSNLKNL